MVASIVRSGSIGAGHVLAADLPRLTTEARSAEWHRHSCVWLAAGVDQRVKMPISPRFHALKLSSIARIPTLDKRRRPFSFLNS